MTREELRERSERNLRYRCRLSEAVLAYIQAYSVTEALGIIGAVIEMEVRTEKEER